MSEPNRSPTSLNERMAAVRREAEMVHSDSPLRTELAILILDIKNLNESYGDSEWAQGVKGGHNYVLGRLAEILDRVP